MFHFNVETSILLSLVLEIDFNIFFCVLYRSFQFVYFLISSLLIIELSPSSIAMGDAEFGESMGESFFLGFKQIQGNIIQHCNLLAKPESESTLTGLILLATTT